MKKLVFLLLISILAFSGCVSLVPTKRLDTLERKIVSLEKQAALGALIAKAEKAGADFYPFSGGIDCAPGAGCLDGQGSTENNDVGFVVLNDHATWGDAVFIYTLDTTGGLTQLLPRIIDASDANEDWELVAIYNDRIYHDNTSTDGFWSGDIIKLQIDDAANRDFAQCYFIAADGNLEAADADGSATMPCMFMGIDTSQANNQRVLVKGVITETDWNWTPGGAVYVGTDPTDSNHGITQTPPAGSGDIVQKVGFALSADSIWFNPSPDIIELQ